MFTLIKFAFRNIFRFKRRTAITFIAISVGLALLVISISLMNGIDKQSISNIIDCQTSHIKIFKKGYYDKRDKIPMNLTISEPEKVKDLIKNIPNVIAFESRVIFGASMINGVDELPCLGVAIEPKIDPNVFNIKQSLIQGQWLEPQDSGMLVGQTLADDMGLKVGDSITLRMITSSQDDSFSWNAIDLDIKGIFDSGNPGVDSARIFVPIAKADEGLSMSSQVTEIVIRLNSADDHVVSTVQKQVREALKKNDQQLEVHTWKDLAGTFLMISKMKNKNSSVIIFIILFIASMGIINTMLMAVMERTREIGMMMAMGMKKIEIMGLFIFEGGFIGIIGSLLGCVLGGLTTWYLEVYGWSLASFGEAVKKMSSTVYPIKDVMYADLSFGVLLMVFVFGTMISILASVYPARKATRLNPVNALRHI